MEYKLYKEENFSISKWTGGVTKQLAIFPENGDYFERRFIWRLSTAVCENEEAVFSKLPDFDRVLMVLSGSVVLAHQDVRVAKLSEMEQDRFDGAYRTKSFGRITDYNLMIAKGNQGFLDAIALTEESQSMTLEDVENYQLKTIALFCRDGFAAVTIGEETVMINPGQQLVVNAAAQESVRISVMGEGYLVRARIFYNYEQGELGPTVIPKEKATFDDFKACIYLANIQFRGASFIFRKLKRQWFDEELTKAINKLEKIYLPFFVGILVLFIIVGLGVSRMEGYDWIWLCLAWLAADIFLISPLMYMAVVPKPVRKHIKDIDHLTPYEQRVREKQLATNERVEKIMKKYKNSGKIVYDEDGNRIK